MTHPLVSVLVPVYGVEKYIAFCARSLFRQTYSEIEYIFVDDCSPDGSIDVLQRVMDEEFGSRSGQVRIVCQDRNRGLGAARLRALQECRGIYVMHVDSDDCITENSVELLVDAALKTGADIVDGAYREFTAEEEKQCGAPYGNGAVLPSRLPKEKYLRQMLLQNIVKNNIWGRLYRRSLYTERGIYPIEGIDYGEDFCVVPRLMLYASRSYIDDVVYLYRSDNTQSYTHRHTPRQDKSLMGANATVYNFFLANDSCGEYLAHLSMGMMNLYRYARQQGIAQNEIDSVLGSVPKGLIPRTCRMLFGSSVPYGIADTVYRLLRRMYL